MTVTYPDKSLFKDQMDAAYEAIGNYAGEENLKAFLGML